MSPEPRPALEAHYTMLALDMETNAAPSPEQRTRSAASNTALIIADFCAYLKSVTVGLRTEKHTHTLSPLPQLGATTVVILTRRLELMCDTDVWSLLWL